MTLPFVKNIKMSKDEIQKLALSVIGFIILVYCYFNFFLGPLNRTRVSAERSIDDLQGKLGSSKNEMLKAANLEKEATTATARFATFKNLSPEGAPIAWFPPRMKLFFANQKIDKVSTRLEGATAFKQPELADWTRHNWNIDLPQTDFATVGAALAELENSEPLLLISKLTIKAETDDPQFQQVSLVASNAIIKR